ncbi:helix-turn-helix domain-containing protein [Lactiplantibacillus plantarum]|nr:helix-turn-helix domain-containing protein [Lactiplantibacillus plantarum]
MVLNSAREWVDWSCHCFLISWSVLLRCEAIITTIIPFKGIIMSEVMKMKTTATILKEIRQHYQISQAKLAKLLNTSVRTVQHWEQADYQPSGTAVRLIQILATDDAVYTALTNLEEENTIMYLEHDDQKFTIMGVQFRNQEEYRATMNAIISNMYEGFEPTKEDVQDARRFYDEGPISAQEMLAKIRTSTNRKAE